MILKNTIEDIKSLIEQKLGIPVLLTDDAVDTLNQYNNKYPCFVMQPGDINIEENVYGTIAGNVTIDLFVLDKSMVEDTPFVFSSKSLRFIMIIRKLIEDYIFNKHNLIGVQFGNFIYSKDVVDKDIVNGYIGSFILQIHESACVDS